MTFEKPTPLTEEFVADVVRPGRYGDGRGGLGLSLLVRTPNKHNFIHKSWAQRLKIAGKETNRGLGPYPKTSLDEARKHAIRNARAVAQGRAVPSHIKVTFRSAAEKIIKQVAPNRRDPRWESVWRSSFEMYAYPVIGDKLIETMEPKDIAKVLAPHWERIPETMRRVKQRIGVVLDRAVKEGRLPHNPARLVYTPSPGSSMYNMPQGPRTYMFEDNVEPPDIQ